MRASRVILASNSGNAPSLGAFWNQTTQQAQAVANQATDAAIDQLLGVIHKAETRMLDQQDRGECVASVTELTATANLGVVQLTVRKTYD